MLAILLSLVIQLHNIQTITYPSGYQVIEADYNNIPVFIGNDHHIYVYHTSTNK